MNMEALLWICLPVLVAGGSALLDEAYTQMHPLRHEETAASVEVPYGGVRHGDVAIRDISLIPE